MNKCKHEMIECSFCGEEQFCYKEAIEALKKRETDITAAAKDVITQFPLVYGEPVPAWIRNLEAALKAAH